MNSLVILIVSVLVKTAYGIEESPTCKKIVPQKDTDWTKLLGSWYHLMFIPGGESFLNCRKMKISEVDTDEQLVYIDFDDVATYDRNPKFHRDGSIFFKWSEKPGVIYTAINTGTYQYKLSYKAVPRRKSHFQNLPGEIKKWAIQTHGLRIFSGFALPHLLKLLDRSALQTTIYKMVSTDYKSYVILTKCNKHGEVQVWVSLKETTVEPELINTITTELLAVGIDASTLNFTTSSQCSG